MKPRDCSCWGRVLSFLLIRSICFKAKPVKTYKVQKCFSSHPPSGFLPPQTLDTYLKINQELNKLALPSWAKQGKGSKWESPPRAMRPPTDISDFVSGLPRPEVHTQPAAALTCSQLICKHRGHIWHSIQYFARSELYFLTRAAWQNIMLDRRERKSNAVLTCSWIKSKILFLAKTRYFDETSSVLF